MICVKPSSFPQGLRIRNGPNESVAARVAATGAAATGASS
jgi:hypothetical protein